ncbi:MAG: hypothetical protein QGI78_03915 [Phycisphaerales bacterium]|jgi:hypothetical protein|nr:hypothetical protein [Phycisphaerales bacterium]
MKLSTTTQLIVLPLGFASIVALSQMAIATNPSATVTSIPNPSGGHVDGQHTGGGHYEGPGDTVPPCDGCSVPPEHCVMPLGFLCGGPECSELEWVPDDPVCKYPEYGFGSDPVWSQGYMLTIGDMVELLQTGAACADAYGNITACIDSPFLVDEVHVFESGWINGYQEAPISQSVTSTVCFNGSTSFPGWPFEETTRNYNCEYVTVCVSFSAACMQQALIEWYASGADIIGSNSWLFYVDFLSCEPCEDDWEFPEPGIEPWQRGVYKGPGDTVPLD